MKRATRKVISGSLAFIFIVIAISGVLAYFFNKDFKNKVNDVLNIKQEEVVDVPETENQSSEDKETIANLQQQVEDNAETIAKLQNQIIDKESQITAKEEQLELVNAELETAQNENSANEELIASLQAEKAALESDIETLTTEIDELKKQYDGSNVQYDIEEMQSFTADKTYNIDLGDVKNVSAVSNTIYKQEETNYKIRKYGTEFNEKLNISLTGIDSSTKYWLSKDGNKLFFLLADNVLVGYENLDGGFNKILEHEIEVEIVNVSAFDDFVFVFTKELPCVYAYKIVNEALVKCSFDLTSFENLSVLETFTHIDIVQGNNGTFMLGFIVPNGDLTDAYTIYLNFDDVNNSFIYDTYLITSGYVLTYILPFHKNNYSDAQIIYLQAGATSSKCRRVIHSIDKTSTDGYNITAYYYTYATTNVYVKSRAVISEKSSNVPVTMWFYYYPQVYRVQFEKYDVEGVKNHLSSNLLYLFQKMPDGTYRAFVLNDLTKEDGSLTELKLPETLEQTNIEKIEALDDVVLFFMNDGSVEVYNILTNCLLVENVSIKSSEYRVLCTKSISMTEYFEKQEQMNNDYSLFLENLGNEDYQLETYKFNSSNIYVQKKEDNETYIFLKTSYSFELLLNAIVTNISDRTDDINFTVSSSEGEFNYEYNAINQTFIQK